MYLENNGKITAKQHFQKNSNKREKYEHQNFQSMGIASRIPWEVLMIFIDFKEYVLVFQSKTLFFMCPHCTPRV